ncbi:DNA polymerase III subunit gamma/tau [Microaerobacter geothermalis]|uniref:DNA polymerase III subunit gamma/tau n=1 Tax=Microaerobacter geothermalis TaxID=674972 RepID=UPI001F2D9AC9|nr:DNA polymerase III subunit gamma/tau [Microaerobacter geothermalis]MCF6095248.1 DNA polymerase III subunit gamma/tau [Microaerobacter geothermalis]
MNYKALYRVWRPNKFADIVGQQHITKTLQNALAERRFSHAYLFCGPRGTGKTSAAKVMAKAVNCLNGPSAEPCNQCEACVSIMDHSVVDIVEIDAASNRGVDEIRDIRDKVKYAPTHMNYKVYIIDEVHMLTPEAFNALLKTLEEPPAHVIFILATTEPHKLPLTIISRCQRFDFKRISISDIVNRLSFVCQEQGISADVKTLTLIAKYAEGGMRDALSLLDQVFSYGGNSITEEDVLSVTGGVSETVILKLVEGIIYKNPRQVLYLFDSLIHEGKDIHQILEGILYFARDLLIYKTAPDLDQLLDRVSIDEHFIKLSQECTTEELRRVIHEFTSIQMELKRINHPRVMVEMVLTKVSQKNIKEDHSGIQTMDEQKLQSLFEKIAQLESKISLIEQGLSQEVSAAAAAPSKVKTQRLNPTGKIAFNKIKETMLQADERQLEKIKRDWQQVLSNVKQKKITVHAWLIDGEPVAASSNTIVLSFKSPIHRETTEREMNRRIIEETLKEYYGSPISILTLMDNQWRTLKNDMNEEGDDEESSSEDSFFEEAFKIAGKGLVEIRD